MPCTCQPLGILPSCPFSWQLCIGGHGDMHVFFAGVECMHACMHAWRACIPAAVGWMCACLGGVPTIGSVRTFGGAYSTCAAPCPTPQANWPTIEQRWARLGIPPEDSNARFDSCPSQPVRGLVKRLGMCALACAPRWCMCGPGAVQDARMQLGRYLTAR